MQIRFQGGVLILGDPQGVQEPTLNTTCFQERIQETDTYAHSEFFKDFNGRTKQYRKFLAKNKGRLKFTSQI
jgi:hypothetical protein